MEEEITDAIHSLLKPNKNKTLGLDGLPLEWYQSYVIVLVSKLHGLFLEAFSACSLLDSMAKAIIVLLPKPVNKDKFLCGSYRPVSLQNSDVKILANVLSYCLTKVILSLINTDQSGFMPGKSAYNNIQQLQCIYISIVLLDYGKVGWMLKRHLTQSYGLICVTRTCHVWVLAFSLLSGFPFFMPTPRTHSY